jgi:biotin carboxyl carrier protein
MFEKTGIKIGSSVFEVTHTEEHVTLNGKEIERPEVTLTGRLVSVKLNDRVERFLVNRNGDDLWLTYCGRVLPLVIETERDRLLKAAANAAEGEHGAAMIKAAMPGLVVRVNVQVGQTVKRGEAVLILEAMKMENEIRSPIDGTVQAILISERDSVEKGAQLIALTQ